LPLGLLARQGLPRVRQLYHPLIVFCLAFFELGAGSGQLGCPFIELFFGLGELGNACLIFGRFCLEHSQLGIELCLALVKLGLPGCQLGLGSQ